MLKWCECSNRVYLHNLSDVGDFRLRYAKLTSYVILHGLM